MEIYLVGGAVRDELLGLSVKDRDWVVVGATPQAMEAQGFKPVGADFPVFLHPETHEEYALARTERKQGHGYHGFTVYSEPDVTLEDDLGRRDLTINAMARSQSGQLIDPYGGRRDLEDRCLRHVSPAFSEDPLRILRTARFASRFAPQGFTVAEETMTLMQGMVASGEVDHLVPERVWQETRRALHEQAPAVYFRVLEACGALARVMPELVTLSESGLTAMTRASEAGAVTAVVYAALLHDRPQEAIESLSQRLKVPNDCQTLARLNRSFCERFAGAEPSVERVMAQLDEGDAWRRPERFEQLLQAAAHSGVDESLVNRVRQCHAAAASVDPQELMALGFKGKALGEAIQRERAERIRQSLV